LRCAYQAKVMKTLLQSSKPTARSDACMDRGSAISGAAL